MRVKAHILVCSLTYVIRKTVGQLGRHAGLGDEPRKVLEEIARLAVVDVVRPTRAGAEIRNRCEQRPTAYPSSLLERVGMHPAERVEMIALRGRLLPETDPGAVDIADSLWPLRRLG